MKFSLLLIFSFYAVASLAQHNAGILENDKESYLNVTDSVIKKELAAFTIKGMQLTGDSSIEGEDILTKIPIVLCSDTMIYFSKTNFFSGFIGVAIALAATQPQLKLTGIRIGFDHSYTDIPATVLIDIVNTMACKPAAKKRRFITHGCEVYRSKDWRQIYIHMVNEEENNRFEVTWIIQSRKYYGRVVDGSV